MLTRVYNVVHTSAVPTPGEQLQQLMTAARHDATSLAKAIGASDRAVREWLKKTDGDPPPSRRKHREGLLRVLGEDPWDPRPKPDPNNPEDVDNLTELRFLDATPWQHVERASRQLAREAQRNRPRHDQSNVVAVDWEYEGVPTRPESPTKTSPDEVRETRQDDTSLLEDEADSVDHSETSGHDSI